MKQKKIRLTAAQRSYKILHFLKTHKLISCRALCIWVGFDAGSLNKCFNGERQIPSTYLQKMERILKKYGYVKK